MTYADFCAHIASYGFISNPMTSAEYDKLSHLDTNILYGIVCDLNAGISFRRAVLLAKEHMLEDVKSMEIVICHA
jgi:hypothetical protein